MQLICDVSVVSILIEERSIIALNLANNSRRNLKIRGVLNSELYSADIDEKKILVEPKNIAQISRKHMRIDTGENGIVG